MFEVEPAETLALWRKGHCTLKRGTGERDDDFD
jgi:hypothetical protein